MKKLLIATSFLAVVFLMTPPWQKPGQFNSLAPLSQWHSISYYPSLANCEADKQNLLKEKSDAAPDIIKFLSASQCIDEKDPRLK